MLVLPLYPQYSGPTTASVCDAVDALGAAASAHVPELASSTATTTTAGYIAALAQRVARRTGRCTAAPSAWC